MHRLTTLALATLLLAGRTWGQVIPRSSEKNTPLKVFMEPESKPESLSVGNALAANIGSGLRYSLVSKPNVADLWVRVHCIPSIVERIAGQERIGQQTVGLACGLILTFYPFFSEHLKTKYFIGTVVHSAVILCPTVQSECVDKLYQGIILSTSDEKLEVAENQILDEFHLMASEMNNLKGKGD